MEGHGKKATDFLKQWLFTVFYFVLFICLRRSLVISSGQCMAAKGKESGAHKHKS